MALMALVAGSVSAQETAMRVTLIDGSTSTFILSQRPKVTFKGENMVIASPEASTEFNRSDVADITFTSDLSSVNSICGSRNTISYVNGIISAPDRFILVYELTGRIVASAQGILNTADLPSGSYIVKADDQSIKIRK